MYGTEHVVQCLNSYPYRITCYTIYKSVFKKKNGDFVENIWGKVDFLLAILTFFMAAMDAEQKKIQLEHA